MRRSMSAVVIAGTMGLISTGSFACGGAAQFGPTAFRGPEQCAYTIRYAGPDARAIISTDWRVDNFKLVNDMPTDDQKGGEYEYK